MPTCVPFKRVCGTELFRIWNSLRALARSVNAISSNKTNERTRAKQKMRTDFVSRLGTVRDSWKSKMAFLFPELYGILKEILNNYHQDAGWRDKSTWSSAADGGCWVNYGELWPVSHVSGTIFKSWATVNCPQSTEKEYGGDAEGEIERRGGRETKRKNYVTNKPVNSFFLRHSPSGNQIETNDKSHPPTLSGQAHVISWKVFTTFLNEREDVISELECVLCMHTDSSCEHQLMD